MNKLIIIASVMSLVVPGVGMAAQKKSAPGVGCSKRRTFWPGDTKKKTKSKKKKENLQKVLFLRICINQ